MHVTVNTQGLKEIVDFLRRFAHTAAASKQKWIAAFGARMLTEHQDALRFGGHADGPQWEPTDEQWVALENKGHNRPLYWTGFASANMNVKLSGGNRAQLYGPHYLRILHHEPGEGSKTRFQQVPMAGEYAVPDDSMAERFWPRTIHLHPREVLWVGDGPDGMAEYFRDELELVYDDLLGRA